MPDILDSSDISGGVLNLLLKIGSGQSVTGVCFLPPPLTVFKLCRLSSLIVGKPAVKPFGSRIYHIFLLAQTKWKSCCFGDACSKFPALWEANKQLQVVATRWNALSAGTLSESSANRLAHNIQSFEIKWIGWLVCTRPIFGPFESRQPSPRNIELDQDNIGDGFELDGLPWEFEATVVGGTLVGLSRNPSLNNPTTTGLFWRIIQRECGKRGIPCRCTAQLRTSGSRGRQAVEDVAQVGRRQSRPSGTGTGALLLLLFKTQNSFDVSI
ncbi:hypothetical protein B0H13DRAFT_1860085 [Mycena leptocephala]|nr:hypothetical protein B0H13DRAFT_1860085 [Mycena leptocephala]